MLGRFALHDDRTLFLFVFAADLIPHLRCSIWQPRKRCCVRGLGTGNGSARTSLGSWIDA